jgi:hypothetical protein
MMTGSRHGEFGERAENTRRENALNNGKAARTVAGRAVDAQDCRLLLEMLGLDTGAPDPRGPVDK